MNPALLALLEQFIVPNVTSFIAKWRRDHRSVEPDANGLCPVGFELDDDGRCREAGPTDAEVIQHLKDQNLDAQAIDAAWHAAHPRP